MNFVISRKQTRSTCHPLSSYRILVAGISMPPWLLNSPDPARIHRVHRSNNRSTSTLEESGSPRSQCWLTSLLTSFILLFFCYDLPSECIEIYFSTQNSSSSFVRSFVRLFFSSMRPGVLFQSFSDQNESRRTVGSGAAEGWYWKRADRFSQWAQASR